MTRNVAVFAIAALLEIAGCFTFWAWLRRGVTPFVAVLAMISASRARSVGCSLRSRNSASAASAGSAAIRMPNVRGGIIPVPDLL